MDEFGLIQRYFHRGRESRFPLGIGDDCAIVDIPDGQQFVFSIDSLVAGVHFFPDDPPELIASRALCVSLSDLAAMGAEPACFTLALSLPEAEETWLAAFSQGLFSIADKYHCELIGGDTVRGPLAITIQVHGTLPRGTAMTRAQAKAGDLVCVTGPLGDGGAALHLLTHPLNLDKDTDRYLRARYYQPEPRFDAAAHLRHSARAAIDVSDGLVADLGHICQASQLGATLNVSKIPFSRAASVFASEQQKRQWMLYGGDDYQLCFTIAPQDYQAMASTCEMHVIGEMLSAPGIWCSESGEALDGGESGYQHFARES